MGVPAGEVARRLERFKDASRHAGLRLTHQRLEIFREVASSEEHPDAEALFRGVRERVPTVSLDTVYRTLWLLQHLGLVTTLGPRRDATRFDANLRPHHHFSCESCGLIRDFESEAFDSLDPPEHVKRWGIVSDVHVEVSGLCSECATRRRRWDDRDQGGSS
jgi:Fur family peroxide stress response transcriptional regulator